MVGDWHLQYGSVQLLMSREPGKVKSLMFRSLNTLPTLPPHKNIHGRPSRVARAFQPEHKNTKDRCSPSRPRT